MMYKVIYQQSTVVRLTQAEIVLRHWLKMLICKTEPPKMRLDSLKKAATRAMKTFSDLSRVTEYM